MTTASYCQFLRNLGHDVINVSGVWWFNSSPYVYSPIPYELEIDPATYELDLVFRRRCLAVRCVAKEPWGRKSYRLIASDPGYDLGALDSKTRNQTRRGLESCAVRAVGFDELAKNGIQLQIDTMQRQGRRVSRNTAAYWDSYFSHAAQCDGAMAWAAYCDKDMAAYLVSFLLEGVAHILIVRSARKYLRYYPNNALLFTFIRHALATGLAREVSIGFESLQPAMGQLEHFKEGMGFKRRTTNQYVLFSPACRKILKGPMIPLLNSALWLFRSDERARKISGLLAWYLDQVQQHAAN